MITYGPYAFSLAELYRVSPVLNDPEIAGRRVWVNHLVKQADSDWLHCTVADEPGNNWLIKPFFVVPDFRVCR